MVKNGKPFSIRYNPVIQVVVAAAGWIAYLLPAFLPPSGRIR